MKKASVLLLAAGLLLSCSKKDDCGHLERGTSCFQGKRVSSTPMAFYLDEGERELLQQEAEAGDSTAARRLSSYYLVTVEDSTTGAFWMEKAAELNDTSAQYNLSVLYQQDLKLKDGRLADYWMERAAMSGDPESIRALQELRSDTTALKRTGRLRSDLPH